MLYALRGNYTHGLPRLYVPKTRGARNETVVSVVVRAVTTLSIRSREARDHPA